MSTATSADGGLTWALDPADVAPASLLGNEGPTAAIIPDTPLARGAWVGGEQPLNYDANDNVVRVDVQNLDADGNPGASPVLTSTFEYDVLDELVRETRELDDAKRREFYRIMLEDSDRLLLQGRRTTGGVSNPAAVRPWVRYGWSQLGRSPVGA